MLGFQGLATCIGGTRLLQLASHRQSAVMQTHLSVSASCIILLLYLMLILLVELC